MPHLSERRGPKYPTFWALGTITAKIGCRSAAALAFTGGVSAARQRLREWLYDGGVRSTPALNQTDVRARFAALMKFGLVAWERFGLAWRR